MIPTMLKRVAVCAALTTWMLGLPGCGVKQSDYDAKVAAVKSQGEKMAKAEDKAAQLQKDLDAAKGEVENSGQAKKDAEAKIKTLEQENADLQKRISKPETAKPDTPKPETPKPESPKPENPTE